MNAFVELLIRVLREPRALVVESDSNAGLARLAGPALLIAILGTALLGFVCGTHRGGLQLLFATIKMPGLFLLPLLIALPAAHALYRACGVDVSWRRLSAAALVGVARSGVVAAAVSPVLWLYYSLGPSYHRSVLALTFCVAVVGTPAIMVVVRSLPRGGTLRIIATAGTMLVIGMTMAQSGWLLRPFVARPAAEVAFLRPVEEDIVSALTYTTWSANEVYPGWEPHADGLLGRPR